MYLSFREAQRKEKEKWKTNTQNRVSNNLLIWGKSANFMPKGAIFFKKKECKKVLFNT